MAIPTWATADTGATDAGGAWSYTGVFASVGLCRIFHVLQDGSAAGTVTLTGATNCEALDGTDGTLTYVGAFNCGNPTAAIQHVWIGRSTAAANPVISGGNSGTDDIYMRLYKFNDVSTGTTLATVIENASAGSTVNVFGTSATAEDASVQTLNVDRLAVNFLGINDDNPFAGFTGQSGGTWTTRASYADATGTDGAIYLIDAAMATAGTIDGGTGSITDSDAWGTIGFALIGTTAPVVTFIEAPPIEALQAVNRGATI